MSRLFGTDGIRGVANIELTPELAFNIGKVSAYLLGKDSEKPLILIGKDTRLSGDLLENALCAGIMSMGGNVYKAGVIPTPAVAYLVRHMKADAGVVISASHNTFEFNGIKIFSGEGFKLDDDLEDEIEDIIVRDMDLNGHISGSGIGHCSGSEEDAARIYGEFLKNTADISLKGMKIVIDCANGASHIIAEKVLKDMGAEVVAICNEPDGININEKCGSTHPEALQLRVVQEQADIGLAFDGDADRLISIDEKGRVIDGDKMIYICAKMLKARGRLIGDKVTVTVMSNIGFHKAMDSIGATVDTTSVGDRYVLERMLETGCVIGGEQSGHIIFLEHSTTGDGILSALQLLTALKLSGEKLSELADEVVIYPQVLRNAAVKNENKKKYLIDPEIAAEIERIEKLMEGDGRVLIRPSGTEPLVRVMIEGKELAAITGLAEGLADLITKKMA